MRRDERWTAREANECIEEREKGCKRKACLNCGLSISWSGEMPPTGDIVSGGYLCLSCSFSSLPLCPLVGSFPFPFFPPIITIRLQLCIQYISFLVSAFPSVCRTFHFSTLWTSHVFVILTYLILLTLDSLYYTHSTPGKKFSWWENDKKPHYTQSKGMKTLLHSFMVKSLPI